MFFSQTGIIKGRVIDKQSEKPMGGASVEFVKTPILKQLSQAPVQRQHICNTLLNEKLY